MNDVSVRPDTVTDRRSYADWTKQTIMDYHRPYIPCCLWILMLVATVTNTAAADRRVSACFNQPKKTIRMTCPEGHMVKVDRMVEGFSEPGRCRYTEGDCTYELKHTIVPCVGRQTCDINLPSGDTGAIMHNCGTHSTYIQIEYSCVPAASITDICEKRHLTAQYGYVMTPRYPANYPDNRNCTLTIRLPYKHQKMKLYAIDLMLESDGSCYDLLYMYDGFRSYTTCSSHARKEMMVTMGNQLQLTFESNSQNREKGFWLYFEAFPYVNQTNMVNNNTTESSSATTLTTTLAAELITMQQSERYRNKQSFPIGILAGVLIAVFVSLILLLVVILYVRRRNQAMSEDSARSAAPPNQITTWPMNNVDYQPDGNSNNHSVRWTNGVYNINDGFYIKQDKLQPKQPFIDTCLETGEEKLIC